MGHFPNLSPWLDRRSVACPSGAPWQTPISSTLSLERGSMWSASLFDSWEKFWEELLFKENLTAFNLFFIHFFKILGSLVKLSAGSRRDL